MKAIALAAMMAAGPAAAVTTTSGLSERLFGDFNGQTVFLDPSWSNQFVFSGSVSAIDLVDNLTLEFPEMFRIVRFEQILQNYDHYPVVVHGPFFITPLLGEIPSPYLGTYTVMVTLEKVPLPASGLLLLAGLGGLAAYRKKSRGLFAQ